MRVFPRSAGPMAHWPRVEAVPGAANALDRLHQRYRLGLLTNAGDSGEVLVRAALRRVGLDGHFDLVLAARELGRRKPDLAFYRLATHVLGCRPDQVIMVGDDYEADIAGAQRAGLRTVWYNPTGTAVPAGSVLPDEQISSLEDLPRAIERLERRFICLGQW